MRIYPLLFLLLASCAETKQPKLERYTFSRHYLAHSDNAPRGGTTTGPAVTLVDKPSTEWNLLQEKEISKQERDRRAILAMAGDYRVTFEFLETIGFKSDYKLDRPYQSWATERVYVLENRDKFVSLQHIMVMYFIKDGNVEGPVTMKHWRQDWKYENRDIFNYVGENTWSKVKVPSSKLSGTWTQEVYHVDDSPRYASYGSWEHTDNFSIWTGNRSGRPLPRREKSVRSDYQILDGVNRHIILPTGWIHEQDNLKRVDAPKSSHFIAKEVGVNRYERIKEHDFSDGDNYFRRTSKYWNEVRSTWNTLLQKRNSVTLKGGSGAMVSAHFQYADQINSATAPSEQQERAKAHVLFHLSPADS